MPEVHNKHPGAKALDLFSGQGLLGFNFLGHLIHFKKGEKE